MINCEGKKTQESIDTLDDAFTSEDEKLSFIPEHSLTPAPDSLSPFLNRSNLRAQIREIAQKKSRGFYALQIDVCLLWAAKDALSNSVQIDFESAIDGLKNLFFLFVKSVLPY